MDTLLHQPVAFGPGLEHFNPTRRYEGLRLRQAARGRITLLTPTNTATLSLYNNSQGTQLLVVRAFAVFTAVQHMVAILSQQGTVGAIGLRVITPVLAGEAPPPGELYSLDSAAAISSDYMLPPFGTPTWGLDFPFAVLQPGWSLTFQDATAAEAMRLAIMWEAIFPDELDYFTTQKHG